MSNRPQNFDPMGRWFVAVLMLGLVVRLIGLGHQSLWLDEMTSIQIASMPLGQILIGRGFDNHTPPLYYVLLHLFGQITPLTEFGLRLFSVCIDFVNIVLLWLVCRRFVERRSALLITSAYAVSPFALYYAQEGRMYTLAVFFALVYTYTLERVVNAEQRFVLWAIMAGIMLALGVYTHYYMAFYAFGVFSAALFAVRRSYERISAIVLSGLLAVVLFAPWIPIAVHLVGGAGQTFRTHLLSVVPYTVFRYVIGYAIFPLNMHTKENLVGAVIAHAPYVVAVFSTLLLLGPALLRRDTLRSSLLVAAGWVLTVPFVVGLLISSKVPMLSERYLIVSFPVFLFVCLAFQDFSRRWSVAATGLFFVLLVVGDIAYFFNPLFGKAQWRDAAGYVERILDHDGLVLVEPDYAAPIFQYYFRGPQPVYALHLLKLENARSEAESQLHRRLRGHRSFVLITSGPQTADTGYAEMLTKYAEKRQTQVFELETGIVCTTWELVHDRQGIKGTLTTGEPNIKS
jgi:mannosyltransferase